MYGVTAFHSLPFFPWLIGDDVDDNDDDDDDDEEEDSDGMAAAGA